MGCQSCHKESQVVEIIEEHEIIPIRYPFKLENKTKKEVPDNLNFLIKAKNLIKILLSQDELYSETLNYILLFSNEQFETLTKQKRNMFGDTVGSKTYKSMSW